MSVATSAALTPAMQQYHRMKAEHPDALLFFRMGDFYELFFEDAVVASRALEIALTSRAKDRDGAAIPMCGVPHHAVTGYVARLVKRGFRVALCEQMEDPRSAKGVVRREVVRVVTPGTQLEASALEAGETSYVLAISPGESALGAAWLDATTGDFFVSEWTGPSRWDRLRDEAGPRPRHVAAHAPPRRGPRHRRPAPPEPGAGGEPRRRRPRGHAARRPRRNRHRHGLPTPARLDPPSPRPCGADPGPSGRRGGAGLPHRGPRPSARGLQGRAGPGPDRRPGDARHRVSARPRRPRPLAAGAARRLRGRRRMLRPARARAAQ